MRTLFVALALVGAFVATATHAAAYLPSEVCQIVGDLGFPAPDESVGDSRFPALDESVGAEGAYVCVQRGCISLKDCVRECQIDLPVRPDEH